MAATETRAAPVGQRTPERATTKTKRAAPSQARARDAVGKRSRIADAAHGRDHAATASDAVVSAGEATSPARAHEYGTTQAESQPATAERPSIGREADLDPAAVLAVQIHGPQESAAAAPSSTNATKPSTRAKPPPRGEVALLPYALARLAGERRWVTLDPDGALTIDARAVSKAAASAPRVLINHLLIDALEAQLRFDGGKIEALRGLGYRLDPVPAALARTTRAAIGLLGLVASSDVAPPSFIAIGERLALALLEQDRQAHAWHRALATALHLLMARKIKDRGKKPSLWTSPVRAERLQAVRDVLEAVVSTAPDAPERFRRPAPAHVEAAAKLFEPTTRSPEAARETERRRSGGPRRGPWGVAQLFAQAFGINDMPDERHAKATHRARVRVRR